MRFAAAAEPAALPGFDPIGFLITLITDTMLQTGFTHQSLAQEIDKNMSDASRDGVFLDDVQGGSGTDIRRSAAGRRVLAAFEDLSNQAVDRWWAIPLRVCSWLRIMPAGGPEAELAEDPRRA